MKQQRCVVDCACVMSTSLLILFAFVDATFITELWLSPKSLL